MKPFMQNKCGYPFCMAYDCAEWCPKFKPRLFGLIPLPRKLGGWLFDLEERIFLKRYFGSHIDEVWQDDDFDDFDEVKENEDFRDD